MPLQLKEYTLNFISTSSASFQTRYDYHPPSNGNLFRVLLIKSDYGLSKSPQNFPWSNVTNIKTRSSQPFALKGLSKRPSEKLTKLQSSDGYLLGLFWLPR